MIIVTFDVETTGANVFTNVCFAVGFCVGYLSSDGSSSIVERGKWCVSLGKRDRESWQERWISQNWEPRCYDEFWSKHTDVLDSLAAQPDLLPNESALAAKLNEFLACLEINHPNFTTAFDTVNFDSVWLNIILQRHEYADLAKNRDGTGYRTGHEIDSIRFGGLGVDLGNWDSLYQALDKVPDAREKLSGEHDPEVDATNMFIDLESIHRYNLRNNR